MKPMGVAACNYAAKIGNLNKGNFSEGGVCGGKKKASRSFTPVCGWLRFEERGAKLCNGIHVASETD
jgi:hypothetical protein